MEEMEQVGRAAGAELQAHLGVRLAERRAVGARRDDLLDQFINFEVDGHRLDDDDVVNIMHMFTVAGLDTVTSSLSCLVAWFATHPEHRQRVVDDPAELPRVIEELMRFESPVPSSGARWATQDIDVNGVPVRAGEMIYLCWAAANLDPSAFERPTEVDLTQRRESPHRVRRRHPPLSRLASRTCRAARLDRSAPPSDPRLLGDRGRRDRLRARRCPPGQAPAADVHRRLRPALSAVGEDHLGGARTPSPSSGRSGCRRP